MGTRMVIRRKSRIRGHRSFLSDTKNCNHFSDKFAKSLLGHGIPGWVNRLAFIGKFCNCCINSKLDPLSPCNSDAEQERQCLLPEGFEETTMTREGLVPLPDAVSDVVNVP